MHILIVKETHSLKQFECRSVFLIIPMNYFTCQLISFPQQLCFHLKKGNIGIRFDFNWIYTILLRITLRPPMLRLILFQALFETTWTGYFDARHTTVETCVIFPLQKNCETNRFFHIPWLLLLPHCPYRRSIETDKQTTIVRNEMVIPIIDMTVRFNSKH
jgi:hypothetical protein